MTAWILLSATLPIASSHGACRIAATVRIGPTVQPATLAMFHRTQWAPSKVEVIRPYIV